MALRGVEDYLGSHELRHTWYGRAVRTLQVAAGLISCPAYLKLVLSGEGCKPKVQYRMNSN